MTDPDHSTSQAWSVTGFIREGLADDPLVVLDHERVEVDDGRADPARVAEGARLIGCRRNRLHDTTGDDLGLIEHPAPNVGPGDVLMLPDGREALVTARVDAEPGPLTELLEVAIAPTPLTSDDSIAKPSSPESETAP
jgi:hypothetical protein